MFQDQNDIFQSIETNILSPNGFLYNEPQFILQNEVNEPITYFSILEVIASGEHKIGNIAGKLGKNVQNITSFISKLIELDIIYKDIPITESNPLKSKKGLYFIKDNFFRFWFCYVLPFKSQLEIGNSQYVLNKLKQNFHSFISPVYERLAISYMLQNYPLLKCGRWWDKHEEIDAVGIGEDFMVIAECKYSNKKLGVDILQTLQKKATKLDSKLPIKHYILFSKSGFTDELQKLQSDTVILIQNLNFPKF
jgi:AAA+ ATPase superfamily predicted ATPase